MTLAFKVALNLNANNQLKQFYFFPIFQIFDHIAISLETFLSEGNFDGSKPIPVGKVLYFCILDFISLPNEKIVDWSILKALQTTKFMLLENQNMSECV